MAKVSLTALLGFTGITGGANNVRNSQKPTLRQREKSMSKKERSFAHLDAAANQTIVVQDQQQTQTLKPAGSYRISSQHSRGHNVAISEEGKNSPVLAVKLLRETKLSSSKIRARLREEPAALSKFTANFMEENMPGWEFLNDEEKSRTAMQLSIRDNDQNGYHASRNRASQTLKSLEEPLTDDEKQAMIENLRLDQNASDPDTPDNIAARKQADDEYQEQVARAIVARNNQMRSTGVFLPGDTRTAGGKPSAPRNELQMIKSGLKSGAIVVSQPSNGEIHP